jgi:beta-galactosidase
VRVTATLKLEGNEGFAVFHTVAYTVCGDASVTVDNDVRFSGPGIKLARIGVRLLLDHRLDHCEFFGRGPMENYADRCRGADLGRYGFNINGQYTYEKPMEYGNHEDVRWAALTGADMPGLLATADGKPMQSAALPHTDEQMLPFDHGIDLPASESTAFLLAAKTLGVGSNSCGPEPLDPYKVTSDPATFSYVLRLLPEDAKPTSDLTRLRPPARPASAVQPQANVRPGVVAPRNRFQGANE